MEKLDIIISGGLKMAFGYRMMNKIQCFVREKLDYFPWSIVGIYKISRKGTF